MWTRGHIKEDRKTGDAVGSQTDPRLSRGGRDVEREEHTLSQESQAQRMKWKTTPRNICL